MAEVAAVSGGLGPLGAALGAATAIGVTAVSAAIAEKQIGAAAVGAIAENEKVFGKVLILTVIPETLVIFGLVIAIMLVGKM